MTEAEVLSTTIATALRTCRIDDPAPIRLIREGDIHHVTHMVSEAILAAGWAAPTRPPTDDPDAATARAEEASDG